MEIKRTKWDNEDTKMKNRSRKERVELLSKSLLEYYKDPDRLNRKHTHVCKFCHYINNSRIGGAAITTVNCRNCDKEITFGNTCTDVFCKECAEELKLCRHCGARMD